MRELFRAILFRRPARRDMVFGDSVAGFNESYARQLALSFRYHGVGIFVAGGTATQETQDFPASVPQFMFLTRRNGNGIAWFDFPGFVFDTDFSRAVGDVINFLGAGMVMFLGGGANRQAGFREALIADGGVSIRE